MQVENYIDVGTSILTYGELLRQAVLNVLFQLCGQGEGGTIVLDAERSTGEVLLHIQRSSSTQLELLSSERFASIRALLQALNAELIAGSEAINNAYFQRVTIRLGGRGDSYSVCR